MLNKIKLYREKLIFMSFMLVAVLSIWTFFIWKDEVLVMLTDISAYFNTTVSFLNEVPLIFYTLAIIILPMIFLPVSPVFILASARSSDESFILVLGYCLLGISLNILLSYFLSRKFGDFLKEKLEKRNIKVPEIPDYAQYEAVFLLRMIPGNPLAVQNYLLGLAGIPFMKYVVVSLPLQYIQVSAYVYFGEGLFEGAGMKLFLGLSFLFVLALIARMLDKAYGHKFRGKNKDDRIS